MKAILLTAAILAASQPAFAGGPVIIEDAAESAPVVRDRDNLLPIILLGLAVAIIASGGSSDVCNGDDPQPEPDGGC